METLVQKKKKKEKKVVSYVLKYKGFFLSSLTSLICDHFYLLFYVVLNKKSF